jgi:hypothetical protein
MFRANLRSFPDMDEAGNEQSSGRKSANLRQEAGTLQAKGAPI